MWVCKLSVFFIQCSSSIKKLFKTYHHSFSKILGIESGHSNCYLPWNNIKKMQINLTFDYQSFKQIFIGVSPNWYLWFKPWNIFAGGLTTLSWHFLMMGMSLVLEDCTLMMSSLSLSSVLKRRLDIYASILFKMYVFQSTSVYIVSKAHPRESL